MPSTAALLLSRQPRYPNNQCHWVQNAARAVEWIKEHDLTLCSSIGMQTWELITALGLIHHLPMRLFVPLSSGESESDAVNALSRQFEIRGDTVTFEAVRLSEGRRSRADLMHARDRAVLAASDLLIPISTRKGGEMERLISAHATGRQVIEDFRCASPDRSHACGYHLDPAELSDEINHLALDFLFHWTRTCSGPWPGERNISYYRSILNSPEFPRTALHTLMRIGKTRMLLASARHMPGNTPTVSFSGLAPREAVSLMRWRARYGQMTFEPYGIGIRKTVGERLGILPVHYYAAGGTPPSDMERWRTQSRGKITDWRSENEYRHRGDFDFSDIDPDDLLLLCRHPHELTTIEAATGLRTIALFRA